MADSLHDLVAFKVYDMDRDGLISNGELFLVLKMMVGNNLKDQQLQQIVDKTIMEADKDGWVAVNASSEDAWLIEINVSEVMADSTLKSSKRWLAIPTLHGNWH